MGECFIVLLVLVLYYRTLQYKYVVDDIRNNQSIKERSVSSYIKNYGKKTIFHIPRLIHQRLYGCSTFGADNPVLDHAVTTVIHAINCLLIYVMLGHNDISFWAAVLYACNPANNQTSIWLNGRRYALNVMITLLCVKSWMFLIFLYPLALSLQVSAIFMPILSLGWVGMLVIAIGFIIFRQAINRKIKQRMSSVMNKEHTQFSPNRLIVVVKTYGIYMWKMLFRGRVFFIYDELKLWGLTKEGNKDAYDINFQFWRGIFFLVISIIGLFYFKGPMMYWWLFMILSTLQWCNVITATQQLADRYMSLPNVFVMFFLSFLLHQAGLNQLLPLIAVMYACMTIFSMGLYKGIIELYKYHNFHDPKNIHTRFLLATYYFNIKDVMACWEITREGIKYNPTDFKMNLQAAYCCRAFNDKKMALHYINIAENNIYQDQEPAVTGIINEFKKSIIGKELNGVNIEKEKELIAQKKSKLSKIDRDRVMKL